jgi:Domain of unknown function (DUF3854)
VNLSICEPVGSIPTPSAIGPLETAPAIQGPNTIQPEHWQEWLASGVTPDLIAANVRSLEGTEAYDYLCYGNLERTSTGRLAAGLLRRYAHTEAGGWWCNGLDPAADWAPMLWGCFKPNAPRIDPRRDKTIKYEHPPQIATRAFFLTVPVACQTAIRRRYSTALPPATLLPPTEPLSPAPTSDLDASTSNFWSWVLTQPQIPIILVEGAKKAACLLSLGYAAIALPGIFNGRRVTRDAAGKIWSESLIPDLSLFATGGRCFSFCFDYETKPNTVKNVNLAILRTAKLLEAQDCDVQVISLPGPEKGVDDFVMAQGPAAFEQILAVARSLPAWQWHQNKQADLTWKPWYTCNTADFTAAIANLLPASTARAEGDALAIAGPSIADPAIATSEYPVLPDSGIVVFSSAKGTGKTKAIAQLVQRDESVLAVGHRIALMRNLCDRLRLDYKDDVDKVGKHFITRDGYTMRIGLCIDSLLAINPHHFVGGILVIDEFMQVLRHLLTGKTCNQEGKRPSLLARLRDLICAAKLVILADADVDDIGIQYIRQLKGLDTPTYLIRNDHQPAGFPVQFLATPSDDAIIHAILQDIQAGKKLFIATDSLSSSAALAKLIQQLEVQSPGLVINSATSGREAERQLITHPNQAVTQYGWVLATPSLATGVSIEVDHFDKVYGLFYGVTTDADITQALNRVRAPIPRVLWCVQQGKNFSGLLRSENPHQIEQALKRQLNYEATVLRTALGCADTLCSEMFELAWAYNPHVKLFTQLAASSNRAMWTLRHAVQERLRYEGNRLEILDVAAVPALQSAIKQARSAVKTEHHQAVAAATILNPAQLAALAQQETLQPEDQLNLEKSRVAEFLALDDVTAADVAFDGQYQSGLLQLEVLLLGSTLAIKRDVQAIARQAQWGNGILPFDQPCYELKRFVRDRLGLLPFLDPHRQWSNEDLEPLGHAARQHRQQVKEILGFSIPLDSAHASNGWIFRLMCHQLGLKITTHFKGSRGHQVKYFAIAPDHYQTTLAILQRRHQRRAQSLDSPDVIGGATVSTPSGLNSLDRGQYLPDLPVPLTNSDNSEERQQKNDDLKPNLDPKSASKSLVKDWLELSNDLRTKIQTKIQSLLETIQQKALVYKG